MPLLPGGDADLQRAIYEAVDAGLLRLVGADGQDRTVTRAGDIAVGSSGLRLAPPMTVDPEPAPGPGPQPRPGPTPEPRPGPGPGPSPDPDPAPVPTEREIAFSLMTSMGDGDTRDAVRRLLLELSNAADEGQVSWAQLQVKVVVSADIADAVEQAARASGTNPSSRPV